ncbi:hypothetical protein ACIQMV_09480 [Streptomyces sp. NPDC091412]|uniref:hypothetical protein n=1 Tax=Streptomyces sp. NPDC091412 TaxID=3366002 RepID=UPI00380F9F72
MRLAIKKISDWERSLAVGVVHVYSRGLHRPLCEANREEEMRTAHTYFEKRLKDAQANGK